MRDILVRLAHSHPLCTCLTKTPDIKYHDELCLYRVVRDAEAEILRLRAEDSYIPNILGHSFHD